jgi:uncharacterized membrane protein
MQFSGKVYNFLKWFCLIALPAIDTFLLTVLPVLGVSKVTVSILVTILSASGTLIGALIGVSTKAYNDSKK